MSSNGRFQGLNVAPLGRRPGAGAWLLLALGLGAAAVGAAHLMSAVQAYRHADDGLTRLEVAHRDRSTASRKENIRPSTPGEIQLANSTNTVNKMLNLNWPPLLDSLEVAAVEVRGGVVVTSLEPSGSQGESSKASLRLVAVSVPIMLRYVEALKALYPIRVVELLGHGPADKITAEAVHFQLSIAWQSYPGADSSRAPYPAAAYSNAGLGPAVSSRRPQSSPAASR